MFSYCTPTPEVSKAFITFSLQNVFDFVMNTYKSYKFKLLMGSDNEITLWFCYLDFRFIQLPNLCNLYYTYITYVYKNICFGFFFAEYLSMTILSKLTINLKAVSSNSLLVIFFPFCIFFLPASRFSQLD